MVFSALILLFEDFKARPCFLAYVTCFVCWYFLKNFAKLQLSNFPPFVFTRFSFRKPFEKDEGWAVWALLGLLLQLAVLCSLSGVLLNIDKYNPEVKLQVNNQISM